jgi:hypothetical protein
MFGQLRVRNHDLRRSAALSALGHTQVLSSAKKARIPSTSHRFLHAVVHSRRVYQSTDPAMKEPRDHRATLQI